jgi:hypothetical protein
VPIRPRKTKHLIKLIVHILDMGFFGKVFGQKKVEKGVLKTTLELLPTLIEEDFSSRIKNMELENAKEIAEIKFLHGKIIALVKEISGIELERKENERFNKAAATAKKQVEKQLLRLMEKVSPENVGGDLSEIRKYVGESYSLLLNEVNSFRKSLAYTSVYLKDEMKQLGGLVQEFLNKLKEVHDKLEKESELFEFENAKERIVLLQQNKKELIELEKEKASILQKIESEEMELAKGKEKREALAKGNEIKELNQLEAEKKAMLDEKQQLKIEVSSMLSTIDRPLQRFKALVDSGRWILDRERRDLLAAFIVNPMLALKKDVNGKQFKEILAEIVKAINDAKIELKDREKEKRLDALQELINFNFFEKIFWRLNEIQKKQIEIDHKISGCVGQKLLVAEEEKGSAITKKISALKEEIVAITNKTRALGERVLAEEKYVLSFSEKVLGRTVTLEN